MFTQPRFLRKNTSELREKLRNMGYQGFKGCSLNHDDKTDEGECLFVSNGDETLIDSFPTYQALDTRTCEYFNLSQVIDCGVNEDLFLALSALRNDSDYRQCFVCTKTYGFDHELNRPIAIKGEMTYMLFCHKIYDAKGQIQNIGINSQQRN